jgi:hypothetical protein
MVFASYSLAPWDMAFKVMFYLVEGECSMPKYQSLLSATKGDKFVTFRIFL